MDFSRANSLPDDYDTDLESPWSNPSMRLSFILRQMTADVLEDLFANGDDFSWVTLMKGRNAFYQKQMADQILRQADEATSLLTDALSIHLNVGQNFTMSTSSTFLALGKVSMDSFSHGLLSEVSGGQVLLPSNLFSTNQTSNSPVSSRVRFLPLTLMDACSRFNYRHS
jgi:hypothetical protein